MSEAKARPEDNAGRCESCNRPESAYETQVPFPVLLGGGWGPGATTMGSMWLCPRCLKEHQERAALRAYDGCAY